MKPNTAKWRIFSVINKVPDYQINLMYHVQKLQQCTNYKMDSNTSTQLNLKDSWWRRNNPNTSAHDALASTAAINQSEKCNRQSYSILNATSNVLLGICIVYLTCYRVSWPARQQKRHFTTHLNHALVYAILLRAMEVLVWSPVSQSISGTGTGSSPGIVAFSCQYHSTIAPYSYSILEEYSQLLWWWSIFRYLTTWGCGEYGLNRAGSG